MLATLPDARMVEIAGAGHTVPGDQPEAFAAAVRSFLA
jgi:pimeloyl-ACP methyl ester carboxylesterase